MWNSFKKYFISGIVVFLPLALTVYLLFLAINFADGILGRFLEPVFMKEFGFYFQGVSIIVGIYLIVLVGFLFTNYLGRSVYNFFDRLLVRLPFFKQVYPALKEMATFLFSRDQLKSFRQVVLLEYPSKGIYSVGFMTNETSEKVNALAKEDLCNVFISSCPSPLTGFLIMVPRKNLIFTDIKIEDAFKFIVSGGVVNPE